MFTASFTDPQGQEFTEAVFKVWKASFYQNTTDSFTVDVSDFHTKNNQTYNQKGGQYNVWYWKDIEAKESGKPPYSLKYNNSETINYNTVDTGDLTVEQICEQHLMNTVIPSMGGTVAAV